MRKLIYNSDIYFLGFPRGLFKTLISIRARAGCRPPHRESGGIVDSDPDTRPNLYSIYSFSSSILLRRESPALTGYLICFKIISPKSVLHVDI